MRAARLALAGALVAAGASAQEPRPLPFDAGWRLEGEATRIETWHGVPALRMRNGGAVRADAGFQDGTIDFDLAMSHHRSFVYLRLRLAGDDGEEIYFRPHKSALPDAIQYTPSWNGDSNWQLYHGQWGTAAATFRRDEWIHVRVVLQGRRAAVFLDHAPLPVMVVRLGREPASGPIEFTTSTPAASTAPAGEPVAAVANVVLRRGDAAWRFESETPVKPLAGMVRRWQLSPAFPVDSVPVERLPDSLLADRPRWPAYDVEPHGVLVVGRHLRRPAEGAGTVARLVLRAEREGLQRLDLGFSDYVTVFLAGRPIFSGDAHYSFDRPRQEGLIGLTQATLWLPLARGENELLFALSDGFGGWGLMARLDPVGGARIAGTIR